MSHDFGHTSSADAPKLVPCLTTGWTPDLLPMLRQIGTYSITNVLPRFINERKSGIMKLSPWVLVFVIFAISLIEGGLSAKERAEAVQNLVRASGSSESGK